MAQPYSHDVFLEARDDFLGSLSKPEQSLFKTCPSTEQLISEVAKFTDFRLNHRALAKPLDKLKGLNDRLESYFKVVDAFVQSNPEYSATTWGAIRLILQLASNFGSFFNKLLDVLMKLGQKFPRYEEILKCSPQNITQGFQHSLKKFYRDLFEFFTAVAKVFRRKNGELRRAIFVVADVTFRPFQSQYGHFLDNIKFHCDVLAEELELLQLKVLLQTQAEQTAGFETQEQQQAKQEKKYNELCQQLAEKGRSEGIRTIKEDLKKWLNRPVDQEIYEALEAADGVRLDGTAEWIFSEPEFLSWKSQRAIADDDGFQNVLWVKGNPGTGKTVLASSVLKFFQDTHIEDETAMPVSYFFLYKYEVTRNPRTAWSLMLSYILDHFSDDKDVLNAFSFAKNGSGNTYALVAELVGLFQMVAYRLPRLILLLDGLDESNDPKEVAASVASVLRGTEAKAILFSRPNVEVLQAHTRLSLRHIDVARAKVDSDVHRILQTNLDQFMPGELPAYCPMSWIVSHLVDCANGMMLWARLMIDYLRQLEDADARFEAITTVTRHEDLVKMYIRILQLISKKLQVERNMAKRVFLYLAYSNRHLDASELREATLYWRKPSMSPGVRGDISPTVSESEWFHSAVLVRCASLVERRGLGYGFVHQSALEFFWTGLDSNNPECQDPDIAQFLVRPAEGHIQIAADCLTYLTTRLPSAPLSGDMKVTIERQRIQDCLPFAAYTAVSWPSHLKSGMEAVARTSRSNQPHLLKPLLEILETLSMFASNKLAIMTWIELQYTVSDDIQHLDGIEDWCTAFDSTVRNPPRELKDIPTTMRCLYTDLKALDSKWGRTLRGKPNSIWLDITAYFDSPFLQKTNAVTVYSMEPASPEDGRLSSDPLTLMSRESGDKSFNAVLSIWSTKEFEEAWIKSTKCKVLDEERFTDWVALFEKYDKRCDPPKKVVEARITLEREEIKQHLQTSLVRRRLFAGQKSRNERHVSHTWSLAFPMAIGPQLDMFLVLGRAYFLDTKRSFTTTEDPPVRSVNLTEVNGRPSSVPGKGKGRANSTWAETSLAFTYSYQISDDSRYILRQELKCLTTVDVTEPVIFALSALGTDDTRECYTLLGQFGSREKMEQLACCSLHQSLPLVLFHTRTIGGPQIVRLWGFKSNVSRGGWPLESESNTTGSPSSLSTPCPPLSGIKMLHFSPCGKNAVVTLAGLKRQEFSLEMDTVFRKALQAAQRAHSRSAVEHSEESTQLVQADQSSALVFPSYGLELGQSLVTGSATHTLSLSTGSSQQALVAVQFSGDTKTSQQILSFPDSWQGMDSGVSASVGECSARENHLDITINRSSKAWYNAVESKGVIMPFLARKDIRAMLPPESTGPGIGTKRPADTIDGPSLSHGHHVAKQRRLLEPAKTAVGNEAISRSGQEFNVSMPIHDADQFPLIFYQNSTD
ncbi:hypothetical protein BKA56DRAFT_596676 [Ilyonectria sp. MPI-CAGE-AT-0026]|nr:hypothetical protein BKA56DRAFT_596676 [Ilyonectria sp. MPI-CAGE-AT-0026]